MASSRARYPSTDFCQVSLIALCKELTSICIQKIVDTAPVLCVSDNEVIDK